MTALSENWAKIQEALKPFPSVQVTAVTKSQPISLLQEAAQLGIKCFGNNYVQEGGVLREGLSGFVGKWHFIGHIQSRKAKDLIGYDCIESLDRLSVAESLQKLVGGKVLDVFIQVNIGAEPRKSGVLLETLPDFLEAMKKFDRLRVTGLMGLPPPLSPVTLRVPFFRKLREAKDQFALRELSLGTSDDYREAVAEGATQIRLGTALFGKRSL